MLRDGRYWSEPRPVIGKHYVAKPKFYGTPEEDFMQSVLLNDGAKKESVVVKVLQFLLGR